MPIPKSIPKSIRALMTSFRPATDGDDPDDVLELSLGQSEARLQNQMQTDKIRAIQQVALRIRNKEDFIKQAKGKAKKMLKEQLAELEREQFLLLRDEILNACKDSTGLIDEAKLRKVPGSDVYFKKIQNRKLTN